MVWTGVLMAVWMTVWTAVCVGVWMVQGSLALSAHHLLSCLQLAGGFLLDWLSHLNLAVLLGLFAKGTICASHYLQGTGLTILSKQGGTIQMKH